MGRPGGRECARGTIAITRCPEACARTALELAGACPPNGGALPSVPSLVSLRSNNTRIILVMYSTVHDLDVAAANRLSRERIEWKKSQTSKRC